MLKNTKYWLLNFFIFFYENIMIIFLKFLFYKLNF